MKDRKNILRVGLTLILCVVLVVGSTRSYAASGTTRYQHTVTPDVLITEVETASLKNAGEEFIELYNTTGTDIDFADTAHNGKDAWKLQYFSSSKLTGLLSTPDWAGQTRTISLTGIIPAHDYYVLAAGTYQPGNLTPEQTYGSTLADDGGALQLVDTAASGSDVLVTIHGQLAWSTDKTLGAGALLYVAPGAGASLQRQPNDDSEYINSDGTTTGFIADSIISPENAWQSPSPVVVTPPSEGDGAGSADGGQATPPDNSGLDTPIITELLPNPAAPQIDANDEYIELYNPNDTPFNLKGYTLQTGETTLHNFTLSSDVLIESHGFRAFYSVDTGLSLSNSGGQARLLDASQNVVDQSASYTSAADGQAWALNENGSWGWTITPTPGAENIIHAPAVPAGVSVVKTAAKATRKSTGKVKGITTTKKKAATPKKTKVGKTPTTKLAANASTPTPAPVHPSVLVAVAVLAVGYMGYEYRKDMANFYHQLRTNRASRRKARV